MVEARAVSDFSSKQGNLKCWLEKTVSIPVEFSIMIAFTFAIWCRAVSNFSSRQGK